MSQPVARSRTSQPSAQPATAGGWWIVLLGWLLPGMGYFLARKWVRGSLVFVCVIGMFCLGLAMHGKVFGFNTSNILDMLGWIGDLCAGALYFITRLVGGGVGNSYSVIGDYGTNFLIAAGLLNLLAASDARDVVLGRKR